MMISEFIESFNIVAGLFSNTLFIYLICRFSKHNLGTYKYLLIVFAVYDLFLTLLHATILPKVRNFATVFSIYSDRFRDNSSLGAFYAAFFNLPFSLLQINFLHSYWAVDNPARLALFSNSRFVLLLSMYLLCQCLAWNVIAFSTELDDSHYVRDYYRSHFNLTVTCFRVMHHWRDDRLNVSQFILACIASAFMSVHISIAIALATRTITGIRKANGFSSTTRSLQIKILRALFAQTSVPVLFVYIPFGCALAFPLLKVNDTFQLANNCMTVSSFFPAWDAIVVILLMKDYRDGLLSMFCHHKSALVPPTTIWMTQTNSAIRKLD